MSKKILITSFYFTVLSTLASAINFAFYPIISHLLSVTDFGDVQLGVSFIMLFASVLTSLSTLALFAVANKEAERNSLGSIERLVISISILLAVITALFAVPIASFLKLQDPSLLYILAVIFVLNIPASTWIGALQGNGQFLASGWISVSASLTKLVAAYLLILLGAGAHGALIGIALGSLIILPLVKVFNRSEDLHYAETFGLFRPNDMVFFRKRKDLLATLGSLTLLALIANIDVIVAKAVLSPESAGAYAQLSTVAKIPYFAGLPITLILFERYIKKTLSRKKSLLSYSGLMVTIGTAVVLLSDLLLRTLFNYKGADKDLLTPLVISFASYSILILCAYQLIADRKIEQLIVLSATSLTAIILLVVSAVTPSALAHSYTYGVLFALLLSLIFTYTKEYE